MSVLKAIKQRLNQTPDFANSQEIDLSEIKIGRFTDQIRQYLQKCKKVNILCLRYCELESLENLPKWKLSAIDLSQNKLKDDAIQVLAKYSKLNQIIASQNQFQNLESLKALISLKELEEVNFSQNPVAAITNYRQTLFNTIQTLQAVDLKDKDGNDLEQEEQFLEVQDDDQQEFGSEDQSEDDEEDEDSESQKPKNKKK